MSPSSADELHCVLPAVGVGSLVRHDQYSNVRTSIRSCVQLVAWTTCSQGTWAPRSAPRPSSEISPLRWHHGQNLGTLASTQTTSRPTVPSAPPAAVGSGAGRCKARGSGVSAARAPASPRWRPPGISNVVALACHPIRGVDSTTGPGETGAGDDWRLGSIIPIRRISSVDEYQATYYIIKIASRSYPRQSNSNSSTTADRSSPTSCRPIMPRRTPRRRRCTNNLADDLRALPRHRWRAARQSGIVSFATSQTLILWLNDGGLPTRAGELDASIGAPATIGSRRFAPGTSYRRTIICIKKRKHPAAWVGCHRSSTPFSRRCGDEAPASNPGRECVIRALGWSNGVVVTGFCYQSITPPTERPAQCERDFCAQCGSTPMAEADFPLRDKRYRTREPSFYTSISAGDTTMIGRQCLSEHRRPTGDATSWIAILGTHTDRPTRCHV